MIHFPLPLWNKQPHINCSDYRHPSQRLHISSPLALSEHQRTQDTLHTDEPSPSITPFEHWKRQHNQRGWLYIYSFTSSVRHTICNAVISSPSTFDQYSLFNKCMIVFFSNHFARAVHNFFHLEGAVSLGEVIGTWLAKSYSA